MCRAIFSSFRLFCAWGRCRPGGEKRQEFCSFVLCVNQNKTLTTFRMSSDLQTRLTEAEKSFKKACEQIVQLNRRLDEMAKRYDRASRENHRSFRYSHRLRMAVTEGVRNMYYEYAANKADEITNLRCQVLQEVGEGNQAPTEGQEDENRVEEDGGGGEMNPIADFEEVGDTDSRMSSSSGANDDTAMQPEVEDDNLSEEVQDAPAVLDEDVETDDTYVAVSSLNSEPDEDMVDVTNFVDGGDSRQTALTSSSQSSSSSSL